MLAPKTPSMLIALLWLGRLSYAFRILPCTESLSQPRCPLFGRTATKIRGGWSDPIKDQSLEQDEDAQNVLDLGAEDDKKKRNSTEPVVVVDGEDDETNEDGVGDNNVEEQLELVDDPTIDEDSSANVDRMEYADAYDEEEEEPILDYGSSEATGSVEWHTTVPIPEETAASGEPAPSSKEETGRLPTIPEEGESVRSDGTILLASEISEEMEAIMLKELHYRRSDLNVIRPEIASIVVAKKVRRPVEGLPANWYKDGTVRSGNNKKALQIARKVAVAVLACAVVVGAGSRVDLGKISWPSRTKKVPPAPKPEPIDDLYLKAFALLEEADPKTYMEEVETEEEEPEHSLRPSEKPDKEPLDETWLDKAITAVERRIKKLFGFR